MPDADKKTVNWLCWSACSNPKLRNAPDVLHGSEIEHRYVEVEAPAVTDAETWKLFAANAQHLVDLQRWGMRKLVTRQAPELFRMAAAEVG